MSSRPVAARKRQRNVESLAPALILLAEGKQAKDVARQMGVSSATILNWMDWAWRHRDQVESHLREHHPQVSQEQRAALWARIARRRAKRERRVDFASLLTRE